MPVVKTLFKEVSAVNNQIRADKIKMGPKTSNISIVDIREMVQSKKSEKEGLVFTYEYTVDYPLTEPKDQSLGKLKIVGEIFYIEDSDKIKEIMNGWNDNKKIPQNILTFLINVGLTDASIEGIYQAHKVGLPPSVPLPHLKPKK